MCHNAGIILFLLIMLPVMVMLASSVVDNSYTCDCSCERAIKQKKKKCRLV